ncbi:MAG: hypothetical protein ACXV2J_08165, partial [Actinomycetes bacterium]
MRWTRGAALTVALVLLSGCGLFGSGSKGVPETDPSVTLTVRSPAFAEGGPIPRDFTCKGANISPPLQWSGVPSTARALALVVSDPDAPGGSTSAAPSSPPTGWCCSVPAPCSASPTRARPARMSSSASPCSTS